MSLDEQLGVLSQKLKDRLKAKDLSAAKIQLDTQLALNSVKGVLAGNSCTLKTLVKICNSLEWTLFDLLNGEVPIAAKSATAAPSAATV